MIDGLLPLFSAYKYPVLILLSIIEGPITALVSGFLVRLGYLAFLPALLILVAGDIISDTIYYFLAVRSGGDRLLKKYGKKYKTLAENSELLKNLWERHGRATVFWSKFAYGLAIPILASAAIFKVPYKMFLNYTILPTVIKYTILVTAGYFLASDYQTAEKYVYLSIIYVPLIVLSFVLANKLALRYLRKTVEKRGK